MVGPSWGLACWGEAGIDTDTSTAMSAKTAANRELGGGLVEFGIMGTRILNAFELRSRYSFEFSLVALWVEKRGGVAPLRSVGMGEFASPSKSLVACAATWAMFSVISCFCPLRSMVTVT